MKLLKITEAINAAILEIFPTAKAYGIATPAKRGEETLPSEGEKYIGIDDTYALQIYHKIGDITFGHNTRDGYGMNLIKTGKVSASMILFINERRLGLKPDELVLLLMAKLPKDIDSTMGLKKVKVDINNVILNSAQVYAQEYKSDTYRLGLEQHLIQVGYSITMVIDNTCLPNCPEDFKL